MNCCIESPEGDLHCFSPNLEYLTTLLAVLTPAEIQGKIALKTSVRGVWLEFSGVGEWRGQEVSSLVIPRWMFCEIAFRELIAAKAGRFVEGLAKTPAAEVMNDILEETELTPRWLL